ncbi:MAG: hypothetical protein WCO04_06200 [Pseudomonadota bacterium]
MRALIRRAGVTGAVHVLTPAFRTFSWAASTLGFVALYNVYDKYTPQQAIAAVRRAKVMRLQQRFSGPS